MTRHRRWCRPRTPCRCDLCAELDLNHPGEGRQLALPIGDEVPLRPEPVIIHAAQGRVT